jgi:HAD superfamily hydrolase (TIGR01450 family)
LGAALLCDRYAGIVCDIDGVVLHLDEAIPGAAEAIAALRQRGLGIGFVTNNATRTRAGVVETLRAAGVQAFPDEVVTSSMAAAALIEPGTRCLVIGMEGLVQPLRERGCVLVRDPGEAEAVVVGWDRELVWDDLRRATLALAGGARFVATNTDASYATKAGPWPGNGAVIAALRVASGREPEIAGKPEPALFRAVMAHLGDGPLLMVGDRPDTDLAGAHALGWDTALVLTGVTARSAVDRVSPRPTWVLDDLRGLLRPPPARAPDERDRPDVRIRSAADADTGAIIAVWERSGLLAYASKPRQELAGARCCDPDLVLVAELSGQVAGILFAAFDGRRGWLHRLAVDPPARRRGLGRLLVIEAERRLAARGAPQVNLLILEEDEAGAFWDAMGYDSGIPMTVRHKSLV